MDLVHDIFPYSYVATPLSQNCCDKMIFPKLLKNFLNKLAMFLTTFYKLHFISLSFYFLLKFIEFFNLNATCGRYILVTIEPYATNTNFYISTIVSLNLLVSVCPFLNTNITVAISNIIFQQNHKISYYI